MFKTQVLFYVCLFPLYNPVAMIEDGTVAIKGGEGKPMKALTPDETEWLFKVSCISLMGNAELISYPYRCSSGLNWATPF
jgi:hypothetical protein